MRKLKPLLEEKNLHSILLFNSQLPFLDPNFNYYTGASGFEKSVAILGKTAELYVPDFEIERARKESWIKNVQKLPGKKPLKQIAKTLKNKNVGINGGLLPVKFYNILKREKVRLKDVSKELAKIRMVKSPDEIRKLEKAVALTKDLFKRVDFKKTEREMAADFIYYLTNKKAEFAFDPIIAYDKNAATPHARISDRKGKVCLLTDIGAKYQGYHADMTRVFNLRKDVEFELVYETVKQAHDLAIDAVAPGISAKEVDKVCRDYLKKKGYKLVHSTGHGIGLTIHERPYISENSKDVLEEGMVFTVEPGVYFKGKYGIRIESDILVTKKGCRVLG